MNGDWPRGCDMCMFVEQDKSGKSMRQEEPVDLKYFNHTTGDVAFAGLKTVEIRFSHSCNMACLHCSQVFSSGWMTKLKRYESDEEDKQHQLHQLTGVMHRKSPDDDLTMSISTERALEIVKDLNKNFPNIERIDFAGGEVLYQKQFFPTLRKLAEHPNAKNMLIMFHSNFNADFDPIELNEVLQPFGKSRIMVSVDSGPRIYPYFRQGSWDKLKSNLSAFQAVNKVTDLNLVCTTSVYQIMEIQDVFAGFLSLGCDWLSSSIVYTPDYLNPSLMMLEYSDKVLEDLDAARSYVFELEKDRIKNLKETQHMRNFIGDINKPLWSDICSSVSAIENIRTYVTNKQPDPKHYEALMVYIRKSDEIWKQNFNNYVVNYKYVDGKIERVV
jgi:MoaA/NifB/PqqE/SkfB family radical SAM enzyme